MRKNIVNVLKIFTGLMIIVLIYYLIGIDKVIEHLKNINLLIFACALVVLFISFILAAINLKIIIDKIKKIRLTKIFCYYLYGWSIGLFAPGKIGEFSIVYFLKDHGLTIGEGVAASLIDKIITVVVIGSISIIGFFIFFDLKTSLILTAVLIIGLIIFISAISNEKVRDFIRSKILRKYEDRFKGFYRSFREILSDKKVIFMNLIVTLIKWTLTSTVEFILFLSIGVQVPFLYIIIISCIVTVVGLIPLTPNGLGTKEAVQIYLYGAVGIDYAASATVALLINFVNYILAGIILLILIKKINLKEMINTIKSD